MAFKVGDKVKVLNDPVEGIITKIKGEIAFVESDGFEYPFGFSDLLKIGIDNEVTFKSKPVKIENVVSETKNFKTIQGRSKEFIPNKNIYGVFEIDLHIQVIISFYPDINRENALNTQLLHAEKCLHWAEMKNIRRLVFIHGVGEGILKERLKGLIEDSYNLKVEDGSYKLYGFGAMEVHFK